MQPFSVPAVFKAIDKWSPVVRRMGQSVGNFAAKAEVNMARVNRAVRKITPSMGALTKQMLSMAGALLIATAITGSIQAVNDYKENIASLQAITGATDKVMIGFSQSIDAVGKDTGKANTDIAKAFEVVGSAKPELLSSAAALGKVTKAAVILSQASGDELEPSALSLTGAMNQFSLGADQAKRVMNALAAGSVAGSANITNIAASMKNFGAVANASNISVEKAIALIEVMGSKTIFAEEAGSKLSAAMLNLKKAGFGYASGQFVVNDALKQARDRMGKLTSAKAKDAFMNKIFGKTGITAGTILIDNISQFEALTVAVTGTNTATEQAALKQSTLAARVRTLRDTLFNMAISAENNTASFSKLSGVVDWVTKNLGQIIKTIGIALIAFTSLKLILFVVTAFVSAFSLVSGIMAATTAAGTAAIATNTTAMAAYNISMGIATAATWLFNVAWLANPITWIVLGIIAAIIGVILLIKNWSKVTDWLIEKWRLLGGFFARVNFVALFRNIGSSIVKFMLLPIILILKLLSKLPGKMGEMARSASLGIDSMLNSISGDTPVINAKVVTATPSPLLNPQRAEFDRTSQNNNTFASTLGININDKGRNIDSIDNPNGIPINLTPSLGGAF